MFERGLPRAAVLAVGLMSMALGCRPAPRAEPDARTEGSPKLAVHYLEIVSNDVDALAGLYQRMHGLTFGPPDADLGQARVATRPDGTLVGIRKPLAAHEQPIVRTYLAVDDIQDAVKKAEASGAVIAYPPTRQGQRGTFAIVIQGDVQHGLWQR
jgi:predicted enzyme related to lactoylglutathione lyase